MSISTQFVDGIIEIRMCGVVTVADLQGHMREVAVIEAREPVTPDRIMDVREGRAGDIRFANIYHFAETRRTELLKNPIRTAILATSPVQFGLARTFQSLNDNPQIAIEIFRDETDARAWLAEKAGDIPVI